MGWALEIGVAAAIIAGVGLATFYLWIWLRNRAEGSSGLMTRSRLTCPKCHQTFDYDYLPGVSFTTVRLGGGRYMACPRCHRWSFFNLIRTRVPVERRLAP